MSKLKEQVAEKNEKIIKQESEIKEDYFLTGSTLQDMVLGGNKNVFGIPAGKIYNIIGDSSSGKTFIATEIIACNKSRFKGKLKWNYDDGESGFSFDTNSLYGFNMIDENTTKRSKTVEDLFVNVSNFLSKLKSDEYGIYVIDSLDGINAKEIEDRGIERIKKASKGEEFDKGTYSMGKQKFLSQEFFPAISEKLSNKKAILIIISQVRDNIGVMFGEKYTVSGGKALTFYCHTRWMLAIAEKLYPSESMKKLGKYNGIRVKVKTKKSKTPRPFRECFITIYFDYGVDDISSNIDYLYDLLTDTGKSKSVKEIEHNGEKLKIKDIIEKTDNDTNLKNELKRLVVEKWESIEDKLKTNRSKKYE